MVYNYATQFINIMVSPEFLYRYLILIHMIACTLLLVQHGFLKLKGTQETRLEVKFMIFLSWIVPLIQLPISLYRIVESLNPHFVIIKPLDIYLNFMWSPMATSFVIWCMQIYLVTSCKCQASRFKSIDSIIYVPKWYYILVGLGLGYLYSHCVCLYCSYTYNWNPKMMLLSIAVICSVGCTMEMIVPLIEKKKINAVSYTLPFMFGSWLYFLHLLSSE